ncbi:MAG: DNRLRE domain-containing protein [Terriglobales bacterium]|jgi:hypothetical protein
MTRTMQNLKTQFAVLLLTTLCLVTSALAQVTPLGDSYTNSADPTTNYGAKTLLDVDGASQATYIQFNLSSIPTGASISQATLKLYVNAVSTAGAFQVYSVNGAWAENTITYDLAPALGSVINSDVPITTADKNQYILIPMTSTVQGWVSNPSSNNGVALIAVSNFDATFDSKESTSTSHPPELDIVFAGDGTITGVNTESGSGLTGGGTSGTLNLSLTTGCAANQVLQWNGSSWACAAVGTGTITGVTAGTDLSGGGTSGNVTLNVNTAALNSVYPQLAANNTFTGNQTVNGNLSATGVVTGSGYQIGSNLFGFGSFANGNAFLGFAGNTTTTGEFNTAVGGTALLANTSGHSNSATGYLALTANTTGFYNAAFGNQALHQNTTGGYNVGIGAYGGQTIDGNPLTGTNLTALGSGSAFGNDSITNSTAIGSNAVVSESNAVVLGCINGVNGCTSSVNVGIGTSSPAAALDVRGSGSGGSTTNTISVISSATGASAIFATNSATSGSADGGYFQTASPSGSAVVGVNNASGAGGSSAAYFQGNVFVTGTLSKGSGSFKIDHPLHPADMYLYHSFVESPDMMNVYNGNVVTDKRGVATVVLPDYFDALNRDFRYQLTTIGTFAQAMVSRKIGHNHFVIRTSKPNVEVSWQVTGIRHDAYAEAHRIQVEEQKSATEQGHYLHPELFGASAEQAIGYVAPAIPAHEETAQGSSPKPAR